jgi:hypothetical protein
VQDAIRLAISVTSASPLNAPKALMVFKSLHLNEYVSGAIAKDTPQISKTRWTGLGKQAKAIASPPSVHLNHGFVLTNVHLFVEQQPVSDTTFNYLLG